MVLTGGDCWTASTHGNHYACKLNKSLTQSKIWMHSSVTGRRGNVEINNSPQVGIEPGPLDLKSSTLPNELKGYLFSSFGRVLDFKSRGPSSILTWDELFISTFPLFPVTWQNTSSLIRNENMLHYTNNCILFTVSIVMPLKCFILTKVHVDLFIPVYVGTLFIGVMWPLSSSNVYL